MLQPVEHSRAFVYWPPMSLTPIRYWEYDPNTPIRYWEYDPMYLQLSQNLTDSSGTTYRMRLMILEERIWQLRPSAIQFDIDGYQVLVSVSSHEYQEASKNAMILSCITTRAILETIANGRTVLLSIRNGRREHWMLRPVSDEVLEKIRDFLNRAKR